MYKRDLCMYKRDLHKRPTNEQKRPMHAQKRPEHTQTNQNLQKRPTRKTYTKDTKKPTQKKP